MTVVFFVWPADALAAQIITTAYGIPVVDLIQIPVMRPHRLDQGKAVGKIRGGSRFEKKEITNPVEGYLKEHLECMQWVISKLDSSASFSSRSH